METNVSYKVAAQRYSLVIGVRREQHRDAVRPVAVELTNLGPHHCVIASHSLTSPLRDGMVLPLSSGKTVLAPGASTDLLSAGLFRGALKGNDGENGWRNTLGVGRGPALVSAIVAVPDFLCSVTVAVEGIAELGVEHSELGQDRKFLVQPDEWRAQAKAFKFEGAELGISEENL